VSCNPAKYFATDYGILCRKVLFEGRKFSAAVPHRAPGATPPRITTRVLLAPSGADPSSHAARPRLQESRALGNQAGAPSAIPQAALHQNRMELPLVSLENSIAGQLDAIVFHCARSCHPWGIIPQLSSMEDFPARQSNAGDGSMIHNLLQFCHQRPRLIWALVRPPDQLSDGVPEEGFPSEGLVDCKD